MLRMMLDSHSQLAIPGESHFIPQAWNARRHYATNNSIDAQKLTTDFIATTHFQQWDLPSERVASLTSKIREPSFRDVVETIYLAYAAYHGKCRWGDKTPIYVLSIRLLANIFPDARFVHIIRDGRDVALSYFSVPWGPASIWQAARKWHRHVSAGREAGREIGSRRYMEIRYEEVVKAPDQALIKVCEFADLSFEPEMLDFYKSAESRIQSRPDRTHFHSSVTKRPSKNMRDWRTQMPASRVLVFEAMAGQLLGELGYERAHEAIPIGYRLGANAATWASTGKIVASRAKRACQLKLGRRAPLGG
jgi:hypothetical protein